MMVSVYTHADPELSAVFDDTAVDTETRTLSEDVADLWQTVKASARREADRVEG
jgi:hypothetical protein